MHIVIAGAGQVGYHIARQLSEERKNVVLVERNRDRATAASENLDCMVVNGDATNLDVLREAGCDKADIFIAVTNSDEINIISCLLAYSNFNIPKKIARLRSLEYFEPFNLSRDIGIDHVVNPELEAAKAIINAVNMGATSDVIMFEDIDIQMRGIFITKESPFLRKTINEIRKTLNRDFIISGIKRESGELVIPSGVTEVKEGDYLYIVAKRDTLESILHSIGKTRIYIRNIAIFGGTRVGVISAKGLRGRKRNIKIIEKDYERCKEIASECSNITVIQGDASDASVFEEENIGEFDVVISVTENEEINLLSALYAKNIGTKRSIALIDKANYMTMAARLDIDAVVSPKISAVSSILKLVRRGNIVGLYSIFGGEAEAIELFVSEDSALAGMPIREIKLPPNSLIVAISRNNESIIPRGDFVIEKNDKMVIFTRKEDVPAVEKMIQA